MSGIAGIIHFDGAHVDPGLADGMTSAMAHRGPDGIRHWSRESAALGQCMLRTTPESITEAQPLSNEDENLVLVMDGRVDNWEELRRDLLAMGVRLRDRSDAELVLRAYETWSGDCLRRIDGDFALVVWDARRREVFCARDRMGSKPFHYFWNGKTFAFASELRSLFAIPWIPRIPNDGMLAELLAVELLSRDETLWRGVLRLVAGHCMFIGPAGLRIERYWTPDLDAVLPWTRDEDFIHHYREAFTDSVRRMSRSHRPVAIEVSGGLDSSAIFCVAEHLHRRDALPAPSINGHTMTFPGGSDADELVHARSVGAYVGAPIHEVGATVQPLSWYSETSRFYRDFPGFPNASMFAALRNRSAERGSRVTLSGEGGDTWLNGNRTYYAQEIIRRRWRVLGECLRADARSYGALRAGYWLMRYGLVPLLPRSVRDGFRSALGSLGARPRLDCYWLSRPLRRVVAARRQRALRQESAIRLPSQRSMLGALEDAFTSQVMERIERDAARAGIEMRHPYLSARMIQLAFAMPERLRLRGKQHKYLHLRAMEGLVPAKLLERGDKAEFSQVFATHLPALREKLIRFAQSRPDLIDSAGIVRLLDAVDGSAQAPPEIWPLWSIFGVAEVFAEY